MHPRCCRPATSSVYYTTSCKHSLVLLRMGEIIARNMLSWLELLINRYCCIYLIYINEHFILSRNVSNQLPWGLASWPKRRLSSAVSVSKGFIKRWWIILTYWFTISQCIIFFFFCNNSSFLKFALRQSTYRLLQSMFSTQRDLVLTLSSSSTLSFP